MDTYKPIIRPYFDTFLKDEEPKTGKFIARGQWADGHLAYALFDEDGFVMEECPFVQLRGYVNGRNCLYMQRI